MSSGRFIYHYCASFQPEIGQIAHIDGIAQMKHRIVAHDDCKELKQAIDKDNCDKMTIKSLSYLGREFE